MFFFRYTVLEHPQHIGICMVYISLIFLFGITLWPVTAFWIGLYSLQTVVEAYFAQNEHNQLKSQAHKKA